MEQGDLAEFGMPAERVQPSSSKRKRSQSGDLYMTYRDTTPKRNRSTDWSRSEKAASSTGKHSVRRKKSQYNLSSLGWRQTRQDNQQKRNGIARASSTSRLREGSGSRFQEGSMNDKPSIVPPSLFMRDNSDHSMAASARSANVDNLMEDYNGGHLRQSIEVQHPIEPHHRPSASLDSQLPHLSNPDTPTKPSGLYRFGRMVASSFNPANVWGSFSRTFRDTKDEMTMRNIEENRKRAQQLADVETKYAGMKAEAEAKYAEMKAAGLFAATSPFTVVNNRIVTTGMQSPARPSVHVSVAQVAAQPQEHTSPSKQPRHDSDSNIVRDRLEQDSAVANQDSSTHEAATPQRALKSYKSLFGIRRPSFANLKRARSDYNLSGIARTSQDASSVSPEKRTAQEGPEPSNLRKSISRRDLGRQQKLSKRVSDLETKLAYARRELNFAIDNASPLPNMPSPHEKYKPNKHMTPTARFRARFLPGGLATLPSESFFPPPPADPADQQEDDPVHLFTPPPRLPTQNPSFDLPLHSLNATIDSTLQSSPNKMLTSPSLPQHYLNTIEKPLPEPPIAEDDDDSSDNNNHNNNNEEDNTMQDYGDQVDSDTIVVAYPSPSQPVSDYDNLNARLKALDRAVEGKSRRKSGNRKRKSEDDKEYRPSIATDDDEEDNSLSLKKPKKRKSLPRSGTRKSSGSTKEDSAVASTSTTRRTVSGSSRKSSGQQSIVEHDSVYEEHTSPVVVIEQEEAAATEPAPSSSLESNSQAVLDMIAEEGGASDSKHDSGVSVTAAQAKSLRNANTRRVSPPTITRCSEMTMTENCEEEVVVTATPGADGVPEMPNSGLEMLKKTKKKNPTTAKTTEKMHQTKKRQQPVPENFEWPDDVF